MAAKKKAPAKKAMPAKKSASSDKNLIADRQRVGVDRPQDYIGRAADTAYTRVTGKKPPKGGVVLGADLMWLSDKTKVTSQQRSAIDRAIMTARNKFYGISDRQKPKGRGGSTKKK